MAKIIGKTTKKSLDTNKAFISNSLIESFMKKGNLSAFKILFFIAQSKIEIGSDVMSLKLDVKHLCDYCNLDVKTLKRNIKQMTETSISIKDNKSESYITVLPYAKFDYNGGFEIKMFSEVLQFIKNTKSQFTVIDALQIQKLSSKHSVKMIMLLEYISNFGTDVAKRKYYELDELNLMFDTNYKRLVEFERKIIVPVKNELDNNSKLSFIYSLKFDKETSTVGRAKAVGVTIDVVQSNHYQGKLL